MSKGKSLVVVIGVIHNKKEKEKKGTLHFIIQTICLAHHYVTATMLQCSVQLAALIIHMSPISVSL